LACSESDYLKNLSISLLPPFSIGLAIETLRKLGRKVAIALEEADTLIARLASQYQAPILSRDSDFFMYDLPKGYIPLDSLVKIEGFGSLSGRVYHRQDLSKALNIPEDLLYIVSGNIIIFII
jgi:hypothetical protein